MWQNTFGPFLRVVGRQIGHIVDKEEEYAQFFLKEYTRNDGADNRAEAPIAVMAIGSTNNLEESDGDDHNLSPSLGTDLVIIGKAMPIYSRDDIPGQPSL